MMSETEITSLTYYAIETPGYLPGIFLYIHKSSDKILVIISFKLLQR